MAYGKAESRGVCVMGRWKTTTLGALHILATGKLLPLEGDANAHQVGHKPPKETKSDIRHTPTARKYAPAVNTESEMRVTHQDYREF